MCFFIPFGLVGTYSSLHIAVKDSRKVTDLSESERLAREQEEDVKEQDCFTHDGTIGGTTGLILAIAGMLVSKRIKQKRIQKKEDG